MRYRFDDVRQLREHLHVVDGRGLLFFRDAKTALGSGHQVLLEVTLGGADQQSILRGQVLGRDEGRSEGVWLEFPDARLARRAAEGPLASRRQRRLPIDLMIEMRADTSTQLCRLLDLSLAGARVTGLSNAVDAGAKVELKLVAPQQGLPAGSCRAEVVRKTSNEAALRFLRDDAETRMFVSRLQLAVQQLWLKAREITHPPICCNGGAVLEPPLPHLSRRLL